MGMRQEWYQALVRTTSNSRNLPVVVNHPKRYFFLRSRLPRLRCPISNYHHHRWMRARRTKPIIDGYLKGACRPTLSYSNKRISFPRKKKSATKERKQNLCRAPRSPEFSISLTTFDSNDSLRVPGVFSTYLRCFDVTPFNDIDFQCRPVGVNIN